VGNTCLYFISLVFSPLLPNLRKNSFSECLYWYNYIYSIHTIYYSKVIYVCVHCLKILNIIFWITRTPNYCYACIQLTLNVGSLNRKLVSMNAVSEKTFEVPREIKKAM
jgi:hypothetical protein